MATVTHHIFSHYDPQQREFLERETGQLPDHTEDPWQTESSFGAQRRLAAAPTFVPARITYDEWGSPKDNGNITQPRHGGSKPGKELAAWYRSMQRSECASSPEQRNTGGRTTSGFQESMMEKTDKKNKNNWFIMKAIQSEAPLASPTPPPSLADILDRDPPPTTNQGKFSPPVWLHLGPSNKGFAMLQQNGWNEGEGLGATVVRRANEVPSFSSYTEPTPLDGALGSEKEVVKRERIDVPLNKDERMKLVEGVEVIDLTASDSDGEDSGEWSNVYADADIQTATTIPTPSSQEPYSQKALLTPIPIVLKSDRLGIGLKAKTVGPFKASRKRVTHNAAAMAAHLRAAEETKKKKREWGRGRRGFEKLHRREEEKRKHMLAYLNR
jgi:hypothetical protein